MEDEMVDDIIESMDMRDMSSSKPQETVKDRQAWDATDHGVAESDKTQWLKNHKPVVFF